MTLPRGLVVILLNMTPRSVSESFHEFTPLSDDVIALVQRSSKKCCAFDPMPTKLVSDCIDVLLPTIKHIINLSLDNAYFPHVWKEAKRFGLDPLYKNFRPVSNLPYVSKLVERSASDQLFAHMSSNGLYPDLQSAYVKNHSTETALLRVKNDIFMNMNKGHVTLLIFLDLSAAFDTVDHSSLLRVFKLDLAFLEKFWSGLHRTCMIGANALQSMELFLIASPCSAVFLRVLVWGLFCL